MPEQTKKKDFVEIKFTGIANNKIFDSNIEEDLKTLDEKAKPQKTIVCIGEGMVPLGLDKERGVVVLGLHHGHPSHGKGLRKRMESLP